MKEKPDKWDLRLRNLLDEWVELARIKKIDEDRICSWLVGVEREIRHELATQKRESDRALARARLVEAEALRVGAVLELFPANVEPT